MGINQQHAGVGDLAPATSFITVSPSSSRTAAIRFSCPCFIFLFFRVDTGSQFGSRLSRVDWRTHAHSSTGWRDSGFHAYRDDAQHVLATAGTANHARCFRPVVFVHFRDGENSLIPAEAGNCREASLTEYSGAALAKLGWAGP